MNSKIAIRASVPDELSGNRLDQIAAQLFPDYSRARLQTWIKSGSLLVNGQLMRTRDKAHTGDCLELNAELDVEERWSAEPIPLDVVFEDESLIVINKPAGIVVHPAAGHMSGTLLNGLLHHCAQLELLPRAGIVHRLDKDTTGLMVVAKTLQAHTSLVQQLQARTVSREYEAIVTGVLTGGGTIDRPLGRHPVDRKKRAVLEEGQQAITHYTVIKRFLAHTHLRVKLETGRTHQIRVHLSYMKYPIVGDKQYGGRLRIPRSCTEDLANSLREFDRQALHAKNLKLIHPQSDEEMGWTAGLPEDMQNLLDVLAIDSQCQ
ncbi:MAG: 23S rRNA pseudouridine(1911/1915/1917) synthase RluD [Gammaproteobacteria bacterium]|nr:23S rRNA pseudouridine(1911/1915/1917) synthase RluD [Gammaproteobacteria bacterium]